jgi:hypothetical protein
MLKFLKNILPAKKEKIFSIAFTDIPAWLNEREQIAREALKHETETPVRNIRNATANLQLIVNNLKGAEQDPETHPKIKTIAKNSLPLFLKAMNASLSKELPEDTNEFYTESVEMLRNCLNAVRGQGRYLMVAFPGEMKATKTGIDAIGHEINAMTGSLAKYKKETDSIDAVKRLCTTLVDMRRDSIKSIEKEERTNTRIQEATGRLSAIARELEQISTDESLQSFAVQKAQFADMEKERDAMMRTYASLSMTASHVFRKAEKIANRKRETAEIHTLKKTMEILSDHHVANGADITAALNVACPIAQRMINDGEISLKNKEERSMFADTTQFCTELSSASARYQDLCILCDKTGQTLATHPIIAKMNSLERERTQLQHMRTNEAENQKELVEWREKTKMSIPGIEGELRKKMGEMIGETVQIIGDDQVLV